jgi:hypothetical protein
LLGAFSRHAGGNVVIWSSQDACPTGSVLGFRRFPVRRLIAQQHPRSFAWVAGPTPARHTGLTAKLTTPQDIAEWAARADGQHTLGEL